MGEPQAEIRQQITDVFVTLESGKNQGERIGIR